MRLTVTDNLSNSGSASFTLSWDTTAPLVDAGITGSYNVQFTQNASITGATTITWSKQSGSGNVTFGSSNAASTTVSMDANDTYVLLLTVSDDAGNSATDTVTIVWDTEAPVVNVGADLAANASISIDATSSDNDLIQTYLWEHIAGGGTCSFTSASTEDTE